MAGNLLAPSATSAVRPTASTRSARQPSDKLGRPCHHVAHLPRPQRAMPFECSPRVVEGDSMNLLPMCRLVSLVEAELITLGQFIESAVEVGGGCPWPAILLCCLIPFPCFLQIGAPRWCRAWPSDLVDWLKPLPFVNVFGFSHQPAHPAWGCAGYRPGR